MEVTNSSMDVVGAFIVRFILPNIGILFEMMFSTYRIYCNIYSNTSVIFYRSID